MWRTLNPTVSSRPPERAASSIARPSTASIASGFSHSTWAPASRAATVISRCSTGIVHTVTKVEVVDVEKLLVVAVDVADSEGVAATSAARLVGVTDGDDLDVVDAAQLLDVETALVAGS